MKKVNACTIIARNYFHYAELLARSYKKLYPSHDFYVLFIDNEIVQSKYYKVVKLSDLTNIPNLRNILFKYDILELSTAVKPFFLKWLLKKNSPDNILYLDPDIYLFNKIDTVFELLDKFECVLTPHITKPFDDNLQPSEWDFIQSGYYNLGFVAFKNNKNTNKFLSWWEDKTYNFGYSDPQNFMFVDQKWMDFAPLYLNTYLLKEKGYNVAYWNLHEYVGKISVKDIKFFHFSGYVPSKDLISKYQNRHTMESIKEYNIFFNFYKKELSKIDLSIIKNYKYPYDYFDNGVRISKAIRKIYRFITEVKNMSFNNPFQTKGPRSFYNFLKAPVSNKKEILISNFSYYLYNVYPSIHNSYPNIDFFTKNKNLFDYINWLINFSQFEYDIPDEFIRDQANKMNRLIYLPFNMNFKDLNLIYIFEKTKMKYNDEAYIKNIYKIALFREPDYIGLHKNLSDLRTRSASKDLILYRLINSNEFRYKHDYSLLIIVYKYFLAIKTALFKIYILILRLFGKILQRIPKYPIINLFGKILKKTKKYTKRNLYGINISGYIDTESGVGESARGIIRALINDKFISLNINNIKQEWLNRGFKKYNKFFTFKHNHKVNLICVNADQVKNVIINHLKPSYIRGKYNIGYWYWESNIFPNEYKESFQFFNEIWVASDFVLNTLNLISPIPVIKIPPSFDVDEIKSYITIESTNKLVILLKKLGINVKKDFVFLSIFDSFSFIERKNPASTILSFKKAFKNLDNVKLIIKTVNLHKTEEGINYFKKLINNDERIILIDKYLSYKDLINLISISNAYVSLHRSEGLGIPIIEAMALSKPVIVTAYGGNMDFCNINNSFLVKWHPYILEKNIGPYPQGTIWADADIDDAASKMIKIFNNKNELEKISKRASLDIKNFFSPNVISKKIKERLKILSFN